MRLLKQRPSLEAVLKHVANDPLAPLPSAKERSKGGRAIASWFSDFALNLNTNAFNELKRFLERRNPDTAAVYGRERRRVKNREDQKRNKEKRRSKTAALRQRNSELKDELDGALRVLAALRDLQASHDNPIAYLFDVEEGADMELGLLSGE